MKTNFESATGYFLSKCFGIFAIIALLSVMPGCDNQKQENDAEELPKSTLQLNNGTKWPANPETTAGINNMIKLLSDFQEGENAADYSLLQKNLNDEFNLIIEKCTMQGEAHNQLHNYLMPLKDLIGRLTGDDTAEIATAMADIDDHLQLYGEFFE